MTLTLNNFLKGVIYFSLAVIPLLAWYVAESNFFPYVTGRNFAFRFLIEISFIAWIILAIRDANYRPKRSLVFYSYSAFLLIMFVANIFGANPYNSFFSNFERMEGWFTHLHLFVYFTILYSVYKTDNDWRKIFGWFAVGNIAVSVQAIFQLLGRKEFFLTNYLPNSFVDLLGASYPVTIGGGFRLDSTLGNAAYFGIYTLFFVFLFIKMSISNKVWRGFGGLRDSLLLFLSVFLILSERIIEAISFILNSNNLNFLASLVWWIGFFGFIAFGYRFVKNYTNGVVNSYIFVFLALINLILLYYTQTRGSYLGFIGGVFIAIYILVLHKILLKIKNNFSKLVVGIVVSLFVFIVAPVSFLIGLNILRESEFANKFIFIQRLTTIKIPTLSEAIDSVKNENFQEMLNTFGETTIVSRILNAKMSVEAISKDIKHLLLGYGQENYLQIFAENYDPRMYAQEPWFDRAHNVFFDWLTAGGILGLLAYLALYLTPIYMLWFARGADNIGIKEKALFSGILIAYFIHNIFVFDNIISLILFVTIIAYIASRTREKEKDLNQNNKNKEFPKYLIYGVPSLAIIITIFISINIVIKPLIANYELMRSLGLFSYVGEYKDFPIIMREIYKSTKNAINLSTFANTEVVEQSLSKVAALSKIDFSQLPEDKKEESVKYFLSYKELIEKESDKLINKNPNARNLSLRGTYEKIIGNNLKAEEFLRRAYEISPNKYHHVFGYIDLLESINKKEEAYKIAKELYEKEKSFIDAHSKYVVMAAKAGKKQEAKQELENIRKKDKDLAKILDAELIALLK